MGLLAIDSHVTLAADEFQHLSNNIECPSRIWLNGANADIVELTSNRRTSDNVLLESASALREGRASTNALGVHIVAQGLRRGKFRLVFLGVKFQAESLK